MTSTFLPAEKSSTSKSLLCFDNPLLDIHTSVDSTFLTRWELSSNGAIMANEQHLPLFDEITERTTDHTKQHLVPGGSGLNTARMLKWCCLNVIPSIMVPTTCIAPYHFPVSFVGTIGKDVNGNVLMQECSKAGVTFLPRYLEESENTELPPNSPTGTCAVLVNGVHRSLVANLGAGAFFDSQWLSQKDDLEQALFAASHLYITGFFLRSSFSTCQSLADFSLQHPPLSIIFNLSAPFIVQCFTESITRFLPSCSVVFGNREEYHALGVAMGWIDSSDRQVPYDDADTMKKSQTRAVMERLLAETRHTANGTNCIVMTNGADSVVVCRRSGESATSPITYTEYPVPEVPLESIVDTNGAGDAFVAGFLAGCIAFEQHWSPEVTEYVAVECGITMAQMTMRSTGCTLGGDHMDAFSCPHVKRIRFKLEQQNII